jgi:ankyrin repeat protein
MRNALALTCYAAAGRLCCSRLKKRKQEVVETLLGKGADINQLDDQGEAALILAAYQDDIRTFQTILGRGVDVNLKAADGRTALIGIAAGVGWPDLVIDNADAVLALLANGADVNAQDVHGTRQ